MTTTFIQQGNVLIPEAFMPGQTPCLKPLKGLDKLENEQPLKCLFK